MQVDAPESTIRIIYSHTNSTLVLQPNLPYLCDIRLPKQQTVDHYYDYFTKLLPNYRLHVSAYKSHYNPSDMWVLMYNHVGTHIRQEVSKLLIKISNAKNTSTLAHLTDGAKFYIRIFQCIMSISTCLKDVTKF